MRLHATATTKTTTTKTTTTKTTTTTTTKAAAVTKRQSKNTKANTTTKARTTTNLTTNSSNFMRDFLLQIFILTTFVAACPFSVYPIVTKAMPQTLIDTNTNNNNNDNNNNNAESAATIKNNAATATTTDTLVAAPTIVAHYAKFATDTPNILLPTLDLDSNEIDNSYFSDYVIANQPISTTTTTTAIATATATKTTPQTVISTTTTTIDTSLNATHINAKSKDLLSLSLLSLNETTTSLLANVTMIAQQQHQQQHQKIAASHKNAINVGNGNSNSNSAATIATVFQQIGAQNIALEPAITSDNNNNDDDDNDYDDNNNNNNDDAGGGVGVGQHTTHNHAQYTMHKSQSHSHSHIQNNRPAGASATIATSSLASAAAMPSATSSSTGNNNNNNKSNIRTSAKKVESKYILPKPQKTDAPMLNYIFDTHSSANKHHHHDQRYGPHFEDVESVGQPTNLTVQAGSSIHLNCRISLLHDKTVSWVRRNALNEKDALDLLTVGQVTYTGDKRYKMEFQYPNNWRLKITNVKKDDEAMYECQISTHPPRVIQINLHVNAPKVMIVDEYGDPLQEKYYETDSTLQLSCVVRNVAMASSVVYWKHGEDVLNYDVTRGGVSVKTELMDDGANSTLFIAKINKTDSGNYTCSISDFQNFTIVVHILNGESFAELHHGGAATSYATLPSTVALIILLLYCATLYTEAHIHR